MKEKIKKDGATVLVEAPEDKQFVLANGKKIGHYVEIADMIEELHHDVLSHHVNDLKHDFAMWISNVFSEEELAQELAKETDPKRIRLLIYKNLVDKYLRGDM